VTSLDILDQAALQTVRAALGSGALAKLVTVFGFQHIADKTKPEECAACQGNCLCHHIGALGGVPCPSDCKYLGTRLDGCHRCDCQGAK
jgi:hypothetical protein